MYDPRSQQLRSSLDVIKKPTGDKGHVRTPKGPL